MALSDEKYILFTTYRRDGTAVSTPVWVVKLDDGKFGFWTSSASAKLKRIAHTSRVTVQPCSASGRLKAGTASSTGTARLATDPEYAEIHSAVVAKYGFMTKITKALGSVIGTLKRSRFPYGDRGVIITLDS